MDSQWATYLDMSVGDIDSVRNFVDEDDDFQEGEYEDTFRFLRESTVRYNPEPGVTEEIEAVQEIPFRVFDGFLLVFRGSKKARYIRNKLNTSDSIRVSQVTTDLNSTYDNLAENFLVEPRKVRINGYEVDKFIVGRLDANVSRVKSFENLLEENVSKYKLLFDGIKSDLEISFYSSGQIRIHGKSEDNFSIFEKIVKELKFDE